MAEQNGRAGRVQIDAIMAVRNEEENIPLIAAAIRALSIPAGAELRMLFVEDNSTDGTRNALRRQAEANRDVRYFCIQNPYGQTAAIAFGMARSDADAVIMMDADGGHPPSAIPQMILAFIEGADVVQGHRISADGRDRHRNAATALFKPTVRLLTGFDADRQNVFFRLISRPIVARLLEDNKTLYFLRLTFLDAASVRTKYVSFVSPKRVLGHSKYTLRRLLTFSLKGFLSLISLPRFLLAECLALTPAAVAFRHGYTLTGAVLAIPAIAVAVQYTMLCRLNPLRNVSVLDQG